MLYRIIVLGGIVTLLGLVAGCSGGGGGSASFQVSFVATGVQVVEGESASIELRLDGAGGALAQDLAVSLVAAGLGEAAPELDFALGGATALFPAGSAPGATVSVLVPALADAFIEADTERATLALIGGALDAGVDGAARFELTIAERDVATLQFASAQSATPSEADGPFMVQVELALPAGVQLATQVSVVVTDTLEGDAESGVDYEALSDLMLVFGPEDVHGSARGIPVVIQQDVLTEGIEHVQLALASPSSRAALGANATHELAILDDELSETPTLYVLSDESGAPDPVDSGDLLSFGTQNLGDEPDAGVLVRIENASLASIALSVATLDGDGGDFSIELQSDDGGLGELPAVMDAPFAPAGEDALQGRKLELDEAALAALDGRARVVLAGLPAPGGSALDLELERLPSPWSAGASLRVDGHEVDLPAALADFSAWRGRVVGELGSEVFLALSPHGSHGWIQRADGALDVLVSERERLGAAARPSTRIVANDLLEAQAARPITLECAGERTNPDGAGGPQANEPGGGSGLVVGAAKLAIETDHQLFQRFGTTEATVAYVTGLVAAISAQYRADAQAELAIEYLGIWATADDPWQTPDNGGGTSAMLDEFMDAWHADGWPVEADLAHFLSGASLGGGIAYVNVLCSDSVGFAVSANIDGDIDWETWDGEPTSMSWDFVVMAHELGHNFGASHTHSYCPPLDACYSNCDNADVCTPGTIMSYCHLCGGMSNIQLEFHAYIANVMRARVAASCFGGGLLEPGASTALRVRFDPTSGAGDKQATLRFSHDAENLPSPFEIELEGTALE